MSVMRARASSLMPINQPVQISISKRARQHLAVAASWRELEVSLPEVLERPPSLAGPVGDAVEQARRTGEAVLQAGARILAVPLRAHERTRGVLVLVRLAPGRHYGAEDTALARELAHRTAGQISGVRTPRPLNGRRISGTVRPGGHTGLHPQVLRHALDRPHRR